MVKCKITQSEDKGNLKVLPANRKVHTNDACYLLKSFVFSSLCHQQLTAQLLSHFI